MAYAIYALGVANYDLFKRLTRDRSPDLIRHLGPRPKEKEVPSLECSNCGTSHRLVKNSFMMSPTQTISALEDQGAVVIGHGPGMEFVVYDNSKVKPEQWYGTHQRNDNVNNRRHKTDRKF